LQEANLSALIAFSFGYINHQTRSYEMSDANWRTWTPLSAASNTCPQRLARQLAGVHQTEEQFRKSRYLEILGSRMLAKESFRIQNVFVEKII
jgi:hypothetical protein